MFIFTIVMLCWYIAMDISQEISYFSDERKLDGYRITGTVVRVVRVVGVVVSMFWLYGVIL